MKKDFLLYLLENNDIFDLVLAIIKIVKNFFLLVFHLLLFIKVKAKLFAVSNDLLLIIKFIFSGGLMMEEKSNFKVQVLPLNQTLIKDDE